MHVPVLHKMQCCYIIVYLNILQMAEPHSIIVRKERDNYTFASLYYNPATRSASALCLEGDWFESRPHTATS